MSKKDIVLPFDEPAAEAIAEEFGTPLHIYDERGIEASAERLNKAFSWAKGYKNFFAVKATPTPGILKLLHAQGMGFDCSSRAELVMVDRMGIKGPDIFYTSNNTPQEDFELAIQLGATVNLDDVAHLEAFRQALNGKQLHRVAARYNPGSLKSGNALIGEPTEAKYGMDIETLIELFKQLKDDDIAEFGLHTMVASNELDPNYFEDTAEVLMDAVAQIEQAAGITFSFINLGGGFGVNYKVDSGAFGVQSAAEMVQAVVKKHGRDKDLQIFTENGRFLTGPNGYLLSRVRYVMHKYKTYIGLDASMQNLMRPGMYGAYHHITIMGKLAGEGEHMYDVVGSLCENNDKFAINRELPEVTAGDLMVIHDAGAHGHAMGFNYNGLLRSAEVLLKKDGSCTLLRRAETVDDYFKTVVW